MTATRAVEVQLTGTDPVALAPDLTVIPVPGHTRGSSCLLYSDRFLFTGDHVAWSIPLARVYAFRDACWYSWEEQQRSLARFAAGGHRFDRLLCGHGWSHDSPADEMHEHLVALTERMVGPAEEAWR